MAPGERENRGRIASTIEEYQRRQAEIERKSRGRIASTIEEYQRRQAEIDRTLRAPILQFPGDTSKSAGKG